MDQYEYMKIRADIILNEIMEQYNVAPLIVNVWAYIEIMKVMYGLP